MTGYGHGMQVCFLIDFPATVSGRRHVPPSDTGIKKPLNNKVKDESLFDKKVDSGCGAYEWLCDQAKKK